MVNVVMAPDNRTLGNPDRFSDSPESYIRIWDISAPTRDVEAARFPWRSVQPLLREPVFSTDSQVFLPWMRTAR